MPIEKLVELLGISIESKEIKALYADWGVAYPKRTTCTANESNIKGKVEKNCIRLYFGRGGNSRFLKPIPTTWEGGYIGIFTMIEFTKKRVGGMPFDVEFAMTADELTAILGEPKVVEFMGTTTTWRKETSEFHELIVSDTLSVGDTEPLRSMTLTFKYEADLYSMENYANAGL